MAALPQKPAHPGRVRSRFDGDVCRLAGPEVTRQGVLGGSELSFLRHLASGVKDAHPAVLVAHVDAD